MSLNYNKYGIQEKAIPKIYANRIVIKKKQFQVTQIDVDCNVLFDFPSFDQFISFCSGDCYDYLFENYLFYLTENGSTLDLDVLNAFESNEIQTKTNAFILNEVELNQVFSKVAYDNLNNTTEENLTKYSRVLPNGERYYQLSYKVKYEIPLEELKNVYFLSNVLVQDPQIDLSLNFGDFPVNSGATQYKNYEIFDATIGEPVRGPITVETVVSEGNVKDKGIVYSISDNQSTPGAFLPEGVDPAIVIFQNNARDEKFSSLKGTLWVGEVHKHANRYMAGATHTDELHPYLDSTVVPNKKIVDLRMIDKLEDSKIDFSSVFDEFEDIGVIENSADTEDFINSGDLF